MSPRNDSRPKPHSSAGPWLVPDAGTFRQAWDLFVLSSFFAILFNLFYHYGIELRVPPEKPRGVMDVLRTTTPSPEYAAFGSTPSKIPAERHTPVVKPSTPFLQLSLEGAKSRFDQGNSVFLDARSAKEYEAGHIPGALSFYADEFDRFAPQALPRLTDPNQELIAYCTGASCELSIHLAQRLSELGYSNIKVFFGGWPEWLKAGYPVRTGGNP